MTAQSFAKRDGDYVRNGTPNLLSLAMPCKPKSMPGKMQEAQSDAPSNGVSLDQMQTANLDVILFHNVRVKVLVRFEVAVMPSCLHG